MQEVFIYLWEESHLISIKKSLKSYLFITVRNRCINHLKTIKITDTDHLIDLNLITTLNSDIFETYNDEEKVRLYEKVHEIIAVLPDKMKQIVIMKYINDYKYKEIADELDVSINTVKTQLKRAKDRILHACTLFAIIFHIFCHP